MDNEKVITYNVKTHLTRVFNNASTAAGSIGVPLVTVNKYLDTPGEGDWPTNGFYLRRERDILEYPFKPIPDVYIATANARSIPAELIHIPSHRYIDKDGTSKHKVAMTVTSATKAAKWLKVNINEVIGCLEGRFSRLSHIGMTAIRNPRVKSRSTKILSDKLKGSVASSVLDRALYARGIMLDSDEEVKFKFSKSLHGTTIDIFSRWPYDDNFPYESTILHAINYAEDFHRMYKDLSSTEAFKYITFAKEEKHLVINIFVFGNTYTCKLPRDTLDCYKFIKSLTVIIYAMDRPVNLPSIQFSINKIFE